MTGFDRYIKLSKLLGVHAPMAIGLSISGVAHWTFYSEGVIQTQMDRENVILPEIVVNDLEKEPRELLKPLFDLLWNAAGIDKCPYYR